METSQNNPKAHLKAIDFFLLLGILISLISTFVSCISLLFKGFDRIMPDTINGYLSINNSVQNSLAFFIVSVIVLYILEFINKKRINKNKEYLLIPLRKWMLLSVLFILGLVILGDLVTLLKYFLSGEITTRFISKVLALFGFSAMVFIYYFHVLTWDNIWSYHSRRAFSYLGILVAILVVIFGFYLIGSPKTQRLIRIDQQRETTIQTINYNVINYWQTTGEMPKTMADLDKFPGNDSYSFSDQDLSLYTYKLTDLKKRNYELCTTFNLSTDVIKSYMDQSGYTYKSSPVYYGATDIAISSDANNLSWDHPAGQYCFKRNIDPKFYPVYKKDNI